MLDKAMKIALSFLDGLYADQVPTTDQVKDIAQSVYQRLGDKCTFTVTELIEEISKNYAITWEESSGVFSQKEHEEWLSILRTEIDWQYWKRYREYLITKKGWSNVQLATLDKDTDKILSRLENPNKEGPWYRKGMVVGDVQSGKTANFTGLLNKSIDSGYQLIIVLAGIHNSLRSQTQNRLDKELVGYDSQKQKWIGVADKGLHRTTKTISQITNSSENGDLKSKHRGALIGKDPVLLVIKKNKTPLEAINSWLKGQASKTGGILKNVPAIIIDDESDQASINTNDEETNPTTINKLIREMLGLIEQKNYVGYTATPFANIFIKDTPEDIFPEDFIIRIRPPSNYIGASRMFGIKGDKIADIENQEALPLYKEVTDHQNFIPRDHKSTFVPTQLPSSMLEAIHSFLLSSTIRAIRKGEELHNTMLIHATRFNGVQEKIWELVEDHIQDIKQIFRYDQGQAKIELKNIFRDLFKDYTLISEQINKNPELEKNKLPEFDLIFKKMESLVERIEVKKINGSSDDILDYQNDKGTYTIAVGGNKLSRGLTLEGLSVSYYLRTSQAYDTLLQMGRWFGYRAGYLDLCRIYTTQELFSAYNFVSLASEELNREFELLEKKKATPRQWGLKVRSHPEGSIIITAANKMRTGVNLQWSFSGKLVQTLSVNLMKEPTLFNIKAFESLVEKISTKSECEFRTEKEFSIWSNVSSKDIQEFLSQYSNHKKSPSSEPSVLNNYIRKCNEVDELVNWTVAVIGARGNSKFTTNVNSKLEFQTVTRLKNYGFDLNQFATVYRSIISREHECIDFPDKSLNVFGAELREKRPASNGLILIYLIEASEVVRKLKKENPNLPNEKQLTTGELPLVSFAISFPTSLNQFPVAFTVNETMLKTLGFDTEEVYED
jgi:hypothetical protein